MKKSELRQMIREVLQEELAKANTLTEAAEVKPGYVLKIWDYPEAKKSGAPSYDSAKEGISYPDFDAVIEALKSEKHSEKGAYEITWIKS